MSQLVAYLRQLPDFMTSTQEELDTITEVRASCQHCSHWWLTNCCFSRRVSLGISRASRDYRDRCIRLLYLILLSWAIAMYYYYSASIFFNIFSLFTRFCALLSHHCSFSLPVLRSTSDSCPILSGVTFFRETEKNSHEPSGLCQTDKVSLKTLLPLPSIANGELPRKVVGLSIANSCSGLVQECYRMSLMLREALLHCRWLRIISLTNIILWASETDVHGWYD